MKNTSAELVAHMASESTKLAVLAKCTRKDSMVYAVTDHDTDIPYGGTIYRAIFGANVSSIEITSELNVDNLEVTGFLSYIGVSEAEIAAGLWDYCHVNMIRVNWADLTMGDEKLKRGWIGQISQGRDTFTNEIRGLTVKLQQPIGEFYSSSCKADLFDARCKAPKVVGVNQFNNIAVSTIVSAQRQFTASALTQAADFFTAGLLKWTTGPNAPLSKEIKVHAASGNILLQEPMPYVVTIADQFTIYAGCQKRYIEDCLTKYGNTDNFRGFPFLPGNDATLRGY